MSRPYEPHIWVLDGTEDGFAEVMVEMNGRIVATAIFGPGVDGPTLIDRLTAEVRRRC